MSNITLFVCNLIYLTEISDANNQLFMKENLENDQGCPNFQVPLYKQMMQQNTTTKVEKHTSRINGSSKKHHPVSIDNYKDDVFSVQTDNIERLWYFANIH